MPSRKRKILLLILIIVIVVSLYFLIRPKPKPPVAPPGAAPPALLFMDNYEDEPTIRVMTHDEWKSMINDTRKKVYWRDKEVWLEKGWLNEEWQYRFDVRPSIASVTGEVAHSGSKSVVLTIPEVPPGYILVGRYIARYFRNQSLIRKGTYEVGAWFYVPEGNYPEVWLSMEDHPSWETFYIVNVVLDTKDGSIIVYYTKHREVIGKVNFRHGEWFKLWIVYTTGGGGYTCGYESESERKTFKVKKPWVGHFNSAYIGYSAYNFYAGGNNLSSEREQKLYIDDFYAKVLEGT